MTTTKYGIFIRSIVCYAPLRSVDYPADYETVEHAFDAVPKSLRSQYEIKLLPITEETPQEEAKLKARLEKARDDLDDVKEELAAKNLDYKELLEVRCELQSRVNSLRAQAASGCAKASKGIADERDQARAEAQQNLKAYQESEAARAVLAKQCERARGMIRAFDDLEKKDQLSKELAYYLLREDLMKD